MSPPSKTPLTLLIDANNLICQMYYGTSGGPEGMTSRAIRAKIQRFVEIYKPQYVLAGIDDGETFRQELAPGYKKRGRRKPDELRELLAEAPALMQSAGAIPITAMHHEADDILATLASKAPGQVVIITADQDMYGLVDSDVSVFDLLTRTLVDTEGATTRYHGVPPSLHPFYKALMGDRADHMPGIRHLTEEEAARLVNTYHTPAALYSALPLLDPETQQLFRGMTLKRLQAYVKVHTLNKDAPTTLALPQPSH